MSTKLGLATHPPGPPLSAADAAAVLAPLGSPTLPPTLLMPAQRWAIAQPWHDAVAPTLGARARLAAAEVARLGAHAGRQALAAAEQRAEAVRVLIACSSTLAGTVPTPDAAIAEALGLRGDVIRLPLLGLGCGALGRAMSLGVALLQQTGDAHGVALLVAAETCSVWAPSGECSPADVDAALTLGDGAGALVLGEHAAAAPAVLASRAAHWPGTSAARGAVITDLGLRHSLSPQQLRTALRQLPGTVARFLADAGTAPEAIDFCVVNPPFGAAVEAAAQLLRADAATRGLAERTWHEAGNTLSAGLAHGLRALTDAAAPRRGALGLTLCLSAGMSCELTLLRWDGRPPVAHDCGPLPH